MAGLGFYISGNVKEFYIYFAICALGRIDGGSHGVPLKEDRVGLIVDLGKHKGLLESKQQLHYTDL